MSVKAISYPSCPLNSRKQAFFPAVTAANRREDELSLLRIQCETVVFPVSLSSPPSPPPPPVLGYKRLLDAELAAFFLFFFSLSPATVFGIYMTGLSFCCTRLYILSTFCLSSTCSKERDKESIAIPIPSWNSTSTNMRSYSEVHSIHVRLTGLYTCLPAYVPT